jgi:hypothetical protein
MKNMIKTPKSRKKLDCYKQALNKFIDDSTSMFDISACKCKCMKLCNCPMERRVPFHEQKFLIDQRTARQMAIGPIDVTTTKINQKRLARRTSDNTTQYNKELPSTSKGSITLDEDVISSNFSETGADSGTNYQPPTRMNIEIARATSTEFNLKSLPVVCDRTGVSDRNAALIASSVLQDAGLINEDNSDLIIDRSRVRRARKRTRSQFQDDGVVNFPLESLFFDGRKDKTLSHDKVGTTTYKKLVTEEHVVLVQEPGSNYIGHVTPITGSARNISATIMDHFASKNIITDNIVAIGCDGTAVNTGPKGGILRLFEKHLNRPLQWLICLLHANELPLRHLIHELDGKTSGPLGFTGPNGKQLLDCEKKPLEQYEAIESSNIEVDADDLSTDQKYLLDIYKAVSSGDCSVTVAMRSPGKMAHSRWLTTASRILRLYVSTVEPNDNLQDIVCFIMKVYVPLWFSIKSKPLISDGAKHVFQMINLSRSLNERSVKIIDKVIQRNAFFAHPENILVAMIHDEKDL